MLNIFFLKTKNSKPGIIPDLVKYDAQSETSQFMQETLSDSGIPGKGIGSPFTIASYALAGQQHIHLIVSIS